MSFFQIEDVPLPASKQRINEIVICRISSKSYNIFIYFQCGLREREESIMIMTRLTQSVVIFAAMTVSILSLTACGSGTKVTPETTPPSSAPSAVDTTVTTTTMPDMPIISGTMATNTQAVTWTVTTFDAKTMYVKLDKGFLKVRTGPGTEYSQIAALSNGMEVTVIGKTDTNWYQMQDGYYVFGQYLSDTQ